MPGEIGMGAVELTFLLKSTGAGAPNCPWCWLNAGIGSIGRTSGRGAAIVGMAPDTAAVFGFSTVVTGSSEPPGREAAVVL